ncbi:MAG: PAS domain-containing protein, partial [Dictyoglomaceae bacterium]|nr:PAS domain-containing protein [Dictyoglomaceae bacterium]
MRRDFEKELYKKLILDSIEEHIVYYDRNMNILYANESAGRSINLSPEDLIGRRCYELWHKREDICQSCPVKRSMETGKMEEGEIVSFDGRVWYIKGYPVKNERGEIVGAVEITQEITEKRKMEEEIKYLSFHDKLTGLYNRAFFEEELKRLDTK